MFKSGEREEEREREREREEKKMVIIILAISDADKRLLLSAILNYNLEFRASSDIPQHVIIN